MPTSNGDQYLPPWDSQMNCSQKEYHTQDTKEAFLSQLLIQSDLMWSTYEIIYIWTAIAVVGESDEEWSSKQIFQLKH